MYKVKVTIQIEPDKPLQERFINIMHDKLLTPAQLEQQVYSMWSQWEKYQGETINKLQVVGVYHRVESPLE